MKPPLLRLPPLHLVAACALAALALLPAGCKPAGSHSPAMPPLPQVTVAPVEQQDLVEWEELTGRTAPIEFVEIRTRVSGHIEKVLFASGQMVKKDCLSLTGAQNSEIPG